MFCRDYATLNVYLINLFKYVRHNLLTVFLDCQVDSAVDVAVRRLTVGIYHIEYSWDARFLFFWKVRKWKFIYIHNQLNEVIKELAAIGIKFKVSVAERGKFRVFGNIFKCYNSFSGVSYFLHGIEKKGYEYLPHPSEGVSLADIENFVCMHPLARPEEMKKQKKKAYEKPEEKKEDKPKKKVLDDSPLLFP